MKVEHFLARRILLQGITYIYLIAHKITLVIKAIFGLVLASICTVNSTLTSCSQPYQPICKSDSYGDDLKGLLNFSEGTLGKKKNVFLNTYTIN